jgi:hypothetical protein
VALGLAGLAVLGGAAFFGLKLVGGGIRVDAVEPARARVGQRVTLSGSGFSAEAGQNLVFFEDRPARVLQASPTRLEVEVPDVAAEAGSERSANVVVRRGGRTSAPVAVSVFQGPRLHGLSPAAAMPGEEVLLAGAGWGLGATVRFGDTPAQLIEVESTRIRALVPQIAGGPGTSAPVVVTVGGVESNAAPFVLGRPPIVTGLAPSSGVPGDVIDVSGVGFDANPAGNDVRVCGIAALVSSAASDSLEVVVPWVAAGNPSCPLELRRPDSTNVGQATLQLAPGGENVPFHFAAEPFTAVPGRPYAVLATAFGPAFVLAASGGHSAVERALEAQRRLNDAAASLGSTIGLNLEARDLEGSPVIALQGQAEALLEVTPEDAAAYDEDWTRLHGRGGPVTPARLARWWEAVGRDIVLLTMRGDRPHFAADLAPEGRALQQLFDDARQSGRPGLPWSTVTGARPALKESLRLLGLRVPATVSVAVAGGAAAAAATPPPARLSLEGVWTGSEVEQGQRRYLTVTFRRGSGTISYEGGITLTVPLLTLEQSGRDQARFSVQIRGGLRQYSGKWDGTSLTGSISTDAAGKNVVATFELKPR